MIEVILTFYIFIVMSLIAKIHIYWMKGGLWPGVDKQDLVNKVIGKGTNFPNNFECLFVVIVFVIMALFPLSLYYQFDIGLNDIYSKYILLFFAFIFLIRASLMLFSFLEKKATPDFVILNKRYYSPLCFTLSFSYLGLYFN